jgi:hypothetical protein
MLPEMPGYERKERLVIRVYPPVSTETMVAALGGGGYPGGPNVPFGHREVRVMDDRTIGVYEITYQPKEV